MVGFWCLVHCLELSLKDALSSTYFTEMDELLLQVYYICEKSPKKCKVLKKIVFELKQCLDVKGKRNMSTYNDCGTRFFAHKATALSSLIDRLLWHIY